MDTTLRFLTSDRELDELRPAWERLWSQDRHSTPFQHPAWLLPWWHHFRQPVLRFATLWRADCLLALLPLYLLDQPGSTQLLLLGAGTSDYLDALLAPECTAQDLGDLLAASFAELGWSEAHLTQLRQNSPLRREVSKLDPEMVRVEPYAGESCSARPAARIADLPTKLRADVRYFRNAAIGHGRLELNAAAAHNLDATFDLLVRFHTERWQQRGESGVLADPLVLAHHREALPQLEAAGLLRLMRLELAGNCIAVLYALADPPDRPGRTQYFYLMGYSMEHSELRPGILLTALASERAADEGFQTIDMLRGEESYKQFWRVEPRPTFGFRIVPRHLEASR